MKYILLALFLVHIVHSAPSEIADEEIDVESAQWGMGGCSSSCGCRQRCAMIWWMPCQCPPCMPSCGCCTTVTTTTTTTTPEPTTTQTTTSEPDLITFTATTPCNGGSCCNSCSCMPCRMPVFWMCPPRCGSSCCGGSSSCCNSSNRSCCGGSSSCCNSSNRSCCGK